MKSLFIGGLADKEIREVTEDDAKVIRIIEGDKREIYKRMNLKGDNKNFALFIEASMECNQVLELLLDSYRDNIKMV